MAKYHLSIVRPEGYLHSNCFAEVAETLQSALRALGHSAPIGENTIDAQATNILLGAHLLDEPDTKLLPASTILYNLEQLGGQPAREQAGEPTASGEASSASAVGEQQGAPLPTWYLGLAAQLRIWDYSPLNLARWQKVPCLAPPVLVPIGFAPELQRITSAPVQDIDVLFYGTLNERRVNLLRQLENTGLRCHTVFGVYGAERDALIARAKIVLNLHVYATELFEIVRVSYLLANAKAVVSEKSPDLGDLADAVAAYPYEELVQGCVALIHSDPARHALEARGAQIFKQRSQVEILRGVLASASNSAPVARQPSAPRRLNLGSGKDWREDCLNIDINDYWKPDAVLDISQPLASGLQLATARFGPVSIGPGCFDEILANDVLEHIPDLTRAMTTALDLLRPGGIFQIHVPYDLSWGAWQDPTHVRAFNERSWLYYTDWFWYLGWTEARFAVVTLEFLYSATGERLRATHSGEELLRTPRAIDSMRISLRKQLLSAEEVRFVTNYLRRPERTAPLIPPDPQIDLAVEYA